MMKVKKSDELDKMANELADFDLDYLYEMLIQNAYCYDTNDDGFSGVSAGVELCLKAQKKNKPIYEVTVTHRKKLIICAYFVASLPELKKFFTKSLEVAKKSFEDGTSFALLRIFSSGKDLEL